MMTPTDLSDHLEETKSVDAADSTNSTEADRLIEDELLVEEISIDGMCGVY